MLAVIRTGGKQYIVEPGTKLEVEKLEYQDGEEITFTDVLLVEKSGKLEIGNPVVEGAEVKAKVLSQVKGEKLIIFKYKPKKRYKRKIGHRQKFTEIEILSIKN
jgi:large subunit ribosomal protein L21